jgi:DNA-binding MarR family transcriptional regulator
MEDFTKFICFQMGSATRKIQKFYNNLYANRELRSGSHYILFSLMQKDGQKLGALAEHLELDNSAITGLVDRWRRRCSSKAG